MGISKSCNFEAVSITSVFKTLLVFPSYSYHHQNLDHEQLHWLVQILTTLMCLKSSCYIPHLKNRSRMGDACLRFLLQRKTWTIYETLLIHIHERKWGLGFIRRSRSKVNLLPTTVGCIMTPHKTSCLAALLASLCITFMPRGTNGCTGEPTCTLSALLSYIIYVANTLIKLCS